MAMHSGLTPWKPGQSGNPGGRPKKLQLTESYRKVLAEEVPDHERRLLKLPKGSTWCDAVARARVRAACMTSVAGTVSAKELADRIEGKPVQRIEVDERPAEFVVVYAPPVEARRLENAIDVPSTPVEEEVECKPNLENQNPAPQPR
jgi:hypothetical protein